MKKITIRITGFCLPLLLAAGIANGQSIERDVIASAGDYFVSPALTLSWTMGESIVETVSNDYMTLTQGFQQGDMITLTTVKDPLAELFDIKVFPNPTVDILNISINSQQDEIIIVQLYNLTGERVLTEKTREKNISLNLADLAAANYLLSLRKLDGGLITTYLINKSK